jgi:hypothetical protein
MGGEVRGKTCRYPLEELGTYVRHQSERPRDPLTRRRWTWAELWRLCRAFNEESAEGRMLRHLFFEWWFFADNAWPSPAICQTRGQNVQVLALQARLRFLRLPLYWSMPPFVEEPLACCGVEDRMRVLDGLLMLDSSMLVWEMVREFKLDQHRHYVNVEFWHAPFLANVADMAVNYHAMKCLRTLLEHGILPVYGLHLACLRGQTAVVRLLLPFLEEEDLCRRAPYTVHVGAKAPFRPVPGMQRDMPWESFWTPLQCAVAGPAPQLHAHLRKHGAQLCDPVEHGESLTYIAMHCGNMSMVPVLLRLYGFTTDEEYCFLDLQHVEDMLRCVTALQQTGGAYRWTGGRCGEVWYRMLRCYLCDTRPVTIGQVLELVQRVRTAFSNTADLAQAERHIHLDYGQSWMEVLFADPLTRRSRLRFVKAFLEGWGCSVPHLELPPLQWLGLDVPPTTETWEKLLAEDVGMIFAGSDEVLDRLCRVALDLARRGGGLRPMYPCLRAPLTAVQACVCRFLLDHYGSDATLQRMLPSSGKRPASA